MSQYNYKHLIVEKRPTGVAIVTMNRPEILNAINWEMHEELEEVFVKLDHDNSVNAIVLTGAGRGFCSGGDQKSLDKGTLPSPTRSGRHLIRNMLEVEVPIVAAVNGVAVGLGATLALFCDVIYASPTARFADTHVNAGVVAGDGGAVMWPLLMGPVRAKHYLMTGEFIPAEKAAAMGMINEVIAEGNRVWVADTQTGLLAGAAGGFQRIIPEGPSQDVFNRLYAYPATLIALPASGQQAPLLTTGQSPADLFNVAESRWQAILLSGLDRGLNAAAYMPSDQRLYISSYGNGLWSQAGGQAPVAVPVPASIGPFISSLATDNDGNLWITTAGPSVRLATLHVRRPDGTFQSFSTVNYPAIEQVVPDDNGFLWLRLDGGGGLLVFDPATNRSRYLSTGTGQGNLLTNSVRALVKDRTGTIWIGTDLGPMVFDDPGGIFDRTPDAQAPLLNRRRLLANELVTSIAVDGGNRKWIGTQTGLYHVAPDGSQLLDSFTASNSPLPGNTVQALAIEPISGRIFIQTSTVGRANGLVSYRGPATEPAGQLSSLTIFPNPVRPDFSGTVGINGLTDNATVKILDAGGQLVYETRSQGGTATWNLRDYRNRPAQTGVYLVVVVTADGMEGLAGKLAVVR